MSTATAQSMQRWLQLHCESSADVAGGIVWSASDEQTQASSLLAQWPREGNLTALLAVPAQAAVQRGRLVVVSPAIAPKELAYNRLIALPVLAGEAVLGAIALAVRVVDGAALQAMEKQLAQVCIEMATGWAMGASSSPLTLHPPEQAKHDAASLMALQATLLSQATLREAGFAMCTELAQCLGCERVSLGGIERHKMKLLAMSGSTDFKNHQVAVRVMVSAMQECADQRAVIHCPSLPTDVARIVLAHAELIHQTGHVLATFPLVHDGRVVGALLTQCRKEMRLDASQVLLCESLATSLGAVVELRQSAEMRWPSRLAASWSSFWRKLWSRQHVGTKLVSAMALIAVITALSVPVSYRVGGTVRVEGAQQRVLSAPMDGYIRSSRVRPGDAVAKGDVLVELADQDLLLEQRKWESTLAQSENTFAAALARGDRAQFIISQGKASEARAQLELVRQQLSRTKLESPIDGILIKGDLSQTMGAPVQRGEVLLTLAPKNLHRLVIDVDERDIERLRPGLSGEIALSALPAESLPMVVERITPVSTPADGRNAFEVEARLLVDTQVLRYGMQGVAKIEVGKRSSFWIWTHRPLNWLRMALWTWVS